MEYKDLIMRTLIIMMVIFGFFVGISILSGIILIIMGTLEGVIEYFHRKKEDKDDFKHSENWGKYMQKEKS